MFELKSKYLRCMGGLLLTRLFFGIVLICFYLITAPANAESKNVLIFAKTAKQAHREIILQTGPALTAFLQKNRFRATFTQDPKKFRVDLLRKFDALVFLDTSEGILDLGQQKAVEDFYRNGRGILAIHSSIALGNDWPWFKKLVGASFQSHPPIHSEEVKLTPSGHHQAPQISVTWSQEDEWYEYTDKIDRSLTIFATENAKPVSWGRDQKPFGRFWYTSMGHSVNLYTGEGPHFLVHILAGVLWVSSSNDLP